MNTVIYLSRTSKLDGIPFFRWFDSGDAYCADLAMAILGVIRGTPHTKHWLPTRSWKVPKIRNVLDQIAAEPNACVRFSGDLLDKLPAEGQNKSVVLTAPSAANSGVAVCEAYTNTPAACNGCRACWNKGVATVGYVAHGQPMKRVLRSKGTDHGRN